MIVYINSIVLISNQMLWFPFQLLFLPEQKTMVCLAAALFCCQRRNKLVSSTQNIFWHSRGDLTVEPRYMLQIQLISVCENDSGRARYVKTLSGRGNWPGVRKTLVSRPTELFTDRYSCVVFRYIQCLTPLPASVLSNSLRPGMAVSP